jgi:hypothetical protein
MWLLKLLKTPNTAETSALFQASLKQNLRPNINSSQRT